MNERERNDFRREQLRAELHRDRSWSILGWGFGAMIVSWVLLTYGEGVGKGTATVVIGILTGTCYHYWLMAEVERIRRRLDQLGGD